MNYSYIHEEGIYSSSDSRISRNFEEFIEERSNLNNFEGLFNKIKEKMFLCSDDNDIQLDSVDIQTFNEKYNIPNVNDTLTELKKNISAIYIKKTENEILINERRRLFENFCNDITKSIKSISEINKTCETDDQLIKLLNDRVEWYYIQLDLENLINNESFLKTEFYFLKKTMIELSGINPVVCAICMENQIAWFVNPCGHTLCESCKPKVEQTDHCHYCRTKKKKYSRLYL